MNNIKKFEEDLISQLVYERDTFHKTGADIFASQVANLAVEIMKQETGGLRPSKKTAIETAYEMLLESRYFFYQKEHEFLIKKEN